MKKNKFLIQFTTFIVVLAFLVGCYNNSRVKPQNNGAVFSSPQAYIKAHNNGKISKGGAKIENNNLYIEQTCPYSPSEERDELIALSYVEYTEQYKSITDAETKYNLWTDKLNSVLCEEWDISQREFIEGIKNSLSPSFFNSMLTEDEEIAFEDAAFELFTQDQVFKIFTVLYDYNQNITYDIETASGGSIGGGNNNCNCRYSIGCGIGFLCVINGCTVVSNCGLLGNSNCKGKCDTPAGQGGNTFEN